MLFLALGDTLTSGIVKIKIRVHYEDKTSTDGSTDGTTDGTTDGRPIFDTLIFTLAP